MTSRHLNPYIAGNPVKGEKHFFGRIDVLREVEKILCNPSTNSIVLFGQRRIGKTSILLQLRKQLRSQKVFTPIYFDLMDKAAKPLDYVLYELAKEISRVTGATLPDQSLSGDGGVWFRNQFIADAIKQANQEGLVLLLDEFDVLDSPQKNQAGSAFFPYLRDWMKSAKGIQFVFVLGRRPEELSTDTLSAFKAIRSRRVSLLSRESADEVIKQSEKNNSLYWNENAVERVWYWTQGHPFFTQLLCSEVWESFFDNDSQSGSDVSLGDIDSAIESALEHGENALQWIWDGLPPAERIVMSAMAEAKSEMIDLDALVDILHRSNVRLILRELELAPDMLIKWDILRKVDQEYRFAVPLLKEWLKNEKPLRRVKKELDSIIPLAQSLVHTAKAFLNMEKNTDAERELRNALDVNPDHLEARLLLGELLIGQGRVSEAIEELQSAYEFDPTSAKSELIKALLALAERHDHIQQLEIFDRILTIDPGQPYVLESKRQIIQNLARKAEKTGFFNIALEHYKELGDNGSIERVKSLLKEKEAAKDVVIAKKLEVEDKWDDAIYIYKNLKEKFPNSQWFEELLNNATSGKNLLENYNRAIEVLENGDSDQAKKLLGKIVSVEPGYRQAPRFLLKAVVGVDYKELIKQNKEASEKILTLERKLEAREKLPNDYNKKVRVEIKKKKKDRVFRSNKKKTQLMTPFVSLETNRNWPNLMLSTLLFWPTIIFVALPMLRGKELSRAFFSPFEKKIVELFYPDPISVSSIIILLLCWGLYTLKATYIPRNPGMSMGLIVGTLLVVHGKSLMSFYLVPLAAALIAVYLAGKYFWREYRSTLLYYGFMNIIGGLLGSEAVLWGFRELDDRLVIVLLFFVCIPAANISIIIVEFFFRRSKLKKLTRKKVY